MKKFLFIFGPPAVGKMTVGHEIEKITALKLFHNHMILEPVMRFFDMSHPSFGRLVHDMRMAFFHEFAASDLSGIIFTGGVDFLDPDSLRFVEETEKLFADTGAEVYYLELVTALDVRLERNKSPHRIAHKPSKADIARSERKLLEFEKECRFNTLEGEFQKERFLRIDNTNIPADEVASVAKRAFEL